jgi:hypothetical protein
MMQVEQTERPTLARWFAAYSFLLLAVHEAHELVHSIVGRLVCGEWPVRDFNAWHFAGECASWWPTAAGPLFSYALMLLGALATRSTSSRWAGIAVLFAANPFARIFTVVMGGGDEMVVGQRLASLSERTIGLRTLVSSIVLIICGSAIVIGWRAMRGAPRRGWLFALILLWPMILTGVALFAGGNGLLRAGVLAAPMLAGAPPLVLLVSGIAIVLTIFTGRWLFPKDNARTMGVQ